MQLVDVVYVARKNVDAKLVSKFDLTRYVIIDFLGRDTCKVVNTVNGRTYIRNIKFLKLAAMLDEGDVLLFDDKIAGKEVDKKVDGEKTVVVDDSAVVRIRSGRVSKSTKLNDYKYY